MLDNHGLIELYQTVLNRAIKLSIDAIGAEAGKEEIDNVLNDLFESGCRLLTMGQYLQPTEKHLPVTSYVEPAQFGNWKKKALEIGFKAAACGPFVRSSYHAAQLQLT